MVTPEEADEIIKNYQLHGTYFKKYKMPNRLDTSLMYVITKYIESVHNNAICAYINEKFLGFAEQIWLKLVVVIKPFI